METTIMDLGFRVVGLGFRVWGFCQSGTFGECRGMRGLCHEVRFCLNMFLRCLDELPGDSLCLPLNTSMEPLRRRHPTP